jgi:hypothetical protein
MSAQASTLGDHNASQAKAIEEGAMSPDNLWYAGQFYGHSPSRIEAITYWILEARCGERYRTEHPGPADTTVKA